MKEVVLSMHSERGGFKFSGLGMTLWTNATKLTTVNLSQSHALNRTATVDVWIADPFPYYTVILKLATDEREVLDLVERTQREERMWKEWEKQGNAYANWLVIRSVTQELLTGAYDNRPEVELVRRAVEEHYIYLADKRLLPWTDEALPWTKDLDGMSAEEVESFLQTMYKNELNDWMDDQDHWMDDQDDGGDDFLMNNLQVFNFFLAHYKVKDVTEWLKTSVFPLALQPTRPRSLDDPPGWQQSIAAKRLRIDQQRKEADYANYIYTILFGINLMDTWNGQAVHQQLLFGNVLINGTRRALGLISLILDGTFAEPALHTQTIEKLMYALPWFVERSP
jgi:hypothetical protein